jgi:hypothetical protein
MEHSSIHDVQTSAKDLFPGSQFMELNCSYIKQYTNWLIDKRSKKVIFRRPKCMRTATQINLNISIEQFIKKFAESGHLKAISEGRNTLSYLQRKVKSGNRLKYSEFTVYTDKGKPVELEKGKYAYFCSIEKYFRGSEEYLMAVVSSTNPIYTFSRNSNT